MSASNGQCKHCREVTGVEFCFGLHLISWCPRFASGAMETPRSRRSFAGSLDSKTRDATPTRDSSSARTAVSWLIRMCFVTAVFRTWLRYSVHGIDSDSTGFSVHSESHPVRENCETKSFYHGKWSSDAVQRPQNKGELIISRTRHHWEGRKPSESPV